MLETNKFALVIRLQKTSSRCLQNVLVKSNLFLLVIRIEDVFKTFSRRLPKKSSRRFARAFSRRLQDIFKTSYQNVFKTSSKHLAKISSRHLQDVLQRCLQDVFKTYHQVKLFLSLIRLREVFNMFLRRTARTVISRRICLGHTSQKFMVSVQNLQKW